MTEVEVVAKRWGSSLGVIIPKQIVDDEHISENQKIVIEIKRNITVNDIWGLIPDGWKISTQELKFVARKGWE